jgi:quinol monooxygenase YgiN
VLAALGPLVEASRREPGCLHVPSASRPENPNAFFLYEQYEDEAAYLAHADSEHFKHYAVGEMFPRRENADRATYVTFEP